MITPAPAPRGGTTRPRAVLPWVALGGAGGAGTSLLLAAALRRPLGALLPEGMAGGPATASLLGPLLAALVLDVAGAFALGVLRGRSARAAAAGLPWDPRVLPTLGTGFLGSFTSFSALTGPLGVLVGSAARGRADVLAGLLPVGAAVLVLAVLGTLAAAAGLAVGRGDRIRAAAPDAPAAPTGAHR